MSLFEKVNSRNVIIFISFVIVSLILWNTYDFSKKIKVDERTKMEVLAKAYDRLRSEDLNQEISLELKIIESNQTIPMIVTNEEGAIMMAKNLDSIKALEGVYLKEQLELMKKENQPIVIDYLKNKQYKIYYKDSDLLHRLKYYPLTLLLILVLFSGIIYMVFRSSKIAHQNKLWTGMAKETAHQIGTPLSSMLGWIELLKIQNVAQDIVPEIENDIHRLNVIAERFSKIGSVPTLQAHNLVEVIEDSISYFEIRTSKNIKFTFQKTSHNIAAEISLQLFSWVLENLIKNAIDAMSGRGDLEIVIDDTSSRHIKITIEDTGKGIPRKQFKKVFMPGFTSKKRGWGLGLSLSKRIVEEYHSGKIFVRKSELDKGTVFEIHLKPIAN